MSYHELQRLRAGALAAARALRILHPHSVRIGRDCFAYNTPEYHLAASIRNICAKMSAIRASMNAPPLDWARRSAQALNVNAEECEIVSFDQLLDLSHKKYSARCAFERHVFVHHEKIMAVMGVDEARDGFAFMGKTMRMVGARRIRGRAAEEINVNLYHAVLACALKGGRHKGEVEYHEVYIGVAPEGYAVKKDPASAIRATERVIIEGMLT